MAVPTEILGPFFCRPIEITEAAGYGYDLGVLGSGTVTVAVGVYANIFHLLGELNDATDTEGKGFYYGIDISKDDPIHPVKIAIRAYPDDAASCAYGSSNTDPITNLGDVADGEFSSDPRTYTADHASPYLWAPTYSNNNQETWERKQSFIGKETETGIAIGCDNGQVISERKYEFPHEYTRRLFWSHAESTEEMGACFEQLTQESLRSYPSVATYPRTSGVWVIRDMAGLLVSDYGDDIYKIADTINWAMPNGLSVNWALHSSFTPYVYCSFSTRRGFGAVASLPKSVARCNASASLHTVATVPTWKS